MQGVKGLAAKRMPFDHVDAVRQRRHGPAARNTDRDSAVITHFDRTKIVEALKPGNIHCCRSVDDGFNNIAVRRESFAGQRLRLKRDSHESVFFIEPSVQAQATHATVRIDGHAHVTHGTDGQ